MIIMITPRTAILKLSSFVDLDVAGNLKQAAEERIYIQININRGRYKHCTAAALANAA
jgi:hypothetical protein